MGDGWKKEIHVLDHDKTGGMQRRECEGREGWRGECEGGGRWQREGKGRAHEVRGGVGGHTVQI